MGFCSFSSPLATLTVRQLFVVEIKIMYLYSHLLYILLSFNALNYELALH